MALEIKLNQKLSQSLVMTPQLQQAIKLLQLGRQEYLEVIEKELLENPVLEDAREDLEEGEQPPLKQEKSEPETLPSDARSGDQSEYQDCLYEESLYSYTGGSNTFDPQDSRSPLETMVSQPEGLDSHLLWQLRTSDATSEEQDIAVAIFGNIDRNGYLCCSVSEIAQLINVPVEKVEQVLKLVQTFDPPGIAARDLQECLMVQLEQQGLSDTLSARILQEHLTKLENHKYDLIAKEENVALESVYDAVRHIRSLEPRPGRPFADEAPIYITPDIYVRKVGDKYLISLNESGMPRLRINEQYKEIFSKSNCPEKSDREYVQECVKSAFWLIKSVHQRQQTIYKVTESIMKFQYEFLEKGIAGLRPLILKDVAEEVGMHESTVSRVTTNKYVHTPQGVFELKYFFSPGLRAGNGEISAESVKERIRDLISKEDNQKPLSDQALVKLLKGEGIDIARRTIAKYREMMGILSSSKRKKLF